MAKKIYRSQRIATFFPAKRDVIAFRFAGCLEIDEQDRITGTTKKSRSINHAQTIRADTRQK